MTPMDVVPALCHGFMAEKMPREKNTRQSSANEGLLVVANTHVCSCIVVDTSKPHHT